MKGTRGGRSTRSSRPATRSAAAAATAPTNTTMKRGNNPTGKNGKNESPRQQSTRSSGRTRASGGSSTNTGSSAAKGHTNNTDPSTEQPQPEQQQQRSNGTPKNKGNGKGTGKGRSSPRISNASPSQTSIASITRNSGSASTTEAPTADATTSSRSMKTRRKQPPPSEEESETKTTAPHNPTGPTAQMPDGTEVQVTILVQSAVYTRLPAPPATIATIGTDGNQFACQLCNECGNVVCPDEDDEYDFSITSQYWGDIHSLHANDDDDDDTPMELLLQVGAVVRAIVSEIRKKDNRVVFSLRMVPPELDESFQPVTLMVFRLPMQMIEDELYATFSRFGPVLDIEFLEFEEEHLPHLRALTKVTMEHKEDATKLIETLAGAKIPYDVENEDGSMQQQFFRIGVEVAHEQTYRERLQARMTTEHQMKVQEWIATSEMKRMDLMAKRSLIGLIPEFDTVV